MSQSNIRQYFLVEPQVSAEESLINAAVTNLEVTAGATVTPRPGELPQ
jgi:hypothetical protein